MIPKYYELPSDVMTECDAYQRDVERFLAGDMPAAVLKAKRVLHGIYEQRQDGTFMTRVRVAGGTLNHEQARELAALSHAFGNGLLHVTTRQDVQFHDVALANTPAIMRRLLAVGLSTRGGGGNSVRNVTACPYAGICPAEHFDVTPCAHAVTEYLISRVGCINLPRKYKIAFSGCSADCALAQVSDLGFMAARRDGQPGFRVLAGGGMGARSRAADTLFEWIPAADIIRVAETVRRLFDRLGDRTNRNRARLRYVFDRIGVDAFRKHTIEEMAEVIREGVPEWRETPGCGDGPSPAGGGVPPGEVRDGIRVIPQRQAGTVAVPLFLPLGFVPAADFARVGELAEQVSAEWGFRTTRAQHLLLRFVKDADVPRVAAALRALTIDVLTPTALDRFVACAGSSTCRLGLCLARNAAQACADSLATRTVARATLDAMQFHINGCPNACGQQPIGSLGFYGATQRMAGRLVPSYVVTIGGRCGADGVRFGMPVGKVAAARLPAVAGDLAADFEARRTPGESFLAFADRQGIDSFKALVGRHTTLPDFAECPDVYRDVGTSAEFSLAHRTAGECGAGVFELIQQDLAASQKAETPFSILLSAARALLITRGIDAQDTDTVLRAFEQHFIETGLIAEEFRPLLTRARGFTQGWQDALDGQMPAITRLRESVERLFATLDANLAFHPPEKQAVRAEAKADPSCACCIPGCVCEPHPSSATESPVGGRIALRGPGVAPGDATAELDLRGVSCPLNFVKAKLKLETMAIGDTLAILLDAGEPVQHVPASFIHEKQTVVGVTDLGDGHWRVVVQKKQAPGEPGR